jgi:hypothetical protein
MGEAATGAAHRHVRRPDAKRLKGMLVSFVLNTRRTLVFPVSERKTRSRGESSVRAVTHLPIRNSAADTLVSSI